MSDPVPSSPSSFAADRTLALRNGRVLTFGRVPRVMGIVNVTPDSFSDGGVNLDRAVAVDSAMWMIEDGASVIDVGGESTRPGAQPVSIEEEKERVTAVIEEIRRRSDVAISIDTRNAAVAAIALDAGADILNDVTALRHDPAMAAAAATRKAPVILMHMRGEPRTMQGLAVYDDVVSDVARELATVCDAAVNAGISKESILVDPGIGFAKTYDQNLELLARCSELTRLGPVVIGASRKAFIGNLTGRGAGPARLAGSLAAAAAAFRGGAALVRVHDVRETVDFLRVLAAIEGRR